MPKRLDPSLSTRALLLFALVRAACAVLPGYIHPDEWFQSNEIAAAEVFNYRTRKPWEFTVDDPVRSVVGVFLSSKLAYIIARAFDTRVPASMVVMYAPRAWMCATSFVVDLAVISSARAAGVDASRAHELFASSWVTLVLLVRPFSNAVETSAVALAALVATYGTNIERYHGARCALIGIIGATAIFVRFTSALYIAPWALLAVARATQKSRIAGAYGVACGVVAATCTAMVCVIMDTAYYTGQYDFRELASDARAWVITPWNLFKYNSNVANLALHGLHSRALHVLVNGPLMFGPLWIIFFARLAFQKPRASEASGDGAESWIVGTLQASVLLPLAALSLAPHQEPRFLAPMIIPLSVLGAKSYSRAEAKASIKTCRRGVVASWIAFNVLMVLIFGILHQGGVVRSTRALASPESPFACASSVHAVYWKTYMPPLSVLAQHPDAERVTITDVGGASASAALAALVQPTPIAAPLERACDARTSLAPSQTSRTILIAPSSAIGELRALVGDALVFVPLARFVPHVAFDDLSLASFAFARACVVQRRALDVVALTSYDVRSTTTSFDDAFDRRDRPRVSEI